MRRFLLFCTYLSILLFPFSAAAADMYLILSKTQVSPQSSFTGIVYVSTGGLPINNAEATIHYPSDLMSVEAVTTAGSIFNIWVEQPSFSNSAGTVTFNGGLPTPGYSGQAGQAIKVTFKARSVGTATISLGAPAIRANDGSGTNVIAQARGASIQIVDATPAPVETEVEPVAAPQPRQLPGSPRAPVITSTDMPDAQSWYNLTKATFAWGLPSDVSTVQLILSKSPNTLPTISYQPPITSKTLDDLNDGILYLNGRFKNDIGWSKVTSRKIQTDTTEPENLMTKVAVTADELVTITASAKDTLSGVHHFTADIGGERVAEVTAEKSVGILTLPVLTAGKHIVMVRAYDAAGNIAQTDVSIDSPIQKPPKITHYPELIQIGSKIEVRGKSPYTTGTVIVSVADASGDTQSYTVKPDEDKVFAVTTNLIKTAGDVRIWAVTARAENIKSAPSDSVYVSVKESELIWYGLRAIQIISLLLIIIALLFLIIIVILLGTRKVRALKRLMRKELARTEQDIHKVFTVLHDDTKRRAHLLEKAQTKRKLTREENAILAEYMDDLRDAEKFLTKEIRDIEERDL